MNQPPQEPTLMTLDTTVHFGKYKNRTVRWIAKYDPEYLWWAKENVAGFRLDQAALDALEDAMMDFREE